MYGTGLTMKRSPLRSHPFVFGTSALTLLSCSAPPAISTNAASDAAPDSLIELVEGDPLPDVSWSHQPRPDHAPSGVRGSETPIEQRPDVVDLRARRVGPNQKRQATITAP